MPFYVGDYLRDTARLTTEGHGAYLLLLFDYWTKGPPPDDDETLASIVKMPLAAWKRMRGKLVGFFLVEDGQWHQKRIDKEMSKATGRTVRKSAAGKKGAAVRWQRDAPANGKRIATAQANASPSHKQIDTQLQPQAASKLAARPASGLPMPHGAIAWHDSGPGKDADDGAHALWAFHELRRVHYGQQTPAFLNPKDLAVVRSWVTRGATFDALRSLFDERMRFGAQMGKEPYGLGYFVQAATELAERAA